MQVRKQTIVRHEFLLTCSHVFDFHLRPLISIKKRDARAHVFGRLELTGDFDWCKRVIDAVAVVAQLLDLCERVCTALFLCDNYVDVDLAVVLRSSAGVMLPFIVMDGVVSSVREV